MCSKPSQIKIKRETALKMDEVGQYQPIPCAESSNQKLNIFKREAKKEEETEEEILLRSYGSNLG